MAGTCSDNYWGLQRGRSLYSAHQLECLAGNAVVPWLGSLSAVWGLRIAA